MNNAPAIEATQQSPIHAASESITAHLKELESSLDMLFSRISPVVRPNPTGTGPAPDKPKEVVSNMRQQMDEWQTKLTIFKVRIAEVVASLDL